MFERCTFQDISFPHPGIEFLEVVILFKFASEEIHFTYQSSKKIKSFFLSLKSQPVIDEYSSGVQKSINIYLGKFPSSGEMKSKFIANFLHLKFPRSVMVCFCWFKSSFFPCCENKNKMSEDSKKKRKKTSFLLFKEGCNAAQRNKLCEKPGYANIFNEQSATV